MATTILLYEDNPQLRESIESMLKLNASVKLVGAFNSPAQVKEHFRTYHPDLLIMDIDMPGMNGVDAVAQIRQENKNVPIIMLTVFDDTQHVFDAIRAGASGYILKKDISSRLFTSISDALGGGVPMSPSVARMVLQKMHQAPGTGNRYDLSPREKEVLASLSKGNSYKLIAAEISVSLDTVRAHIRNIYEKLHVHTQVEAVAKALNEKLI